MCRAAALQACGGGRGSKGGKSSLVPQEARNLQSHFACWLVYKSEEGREATFINHVVDLQEYEICRCSPIFP